MSGACPCCAAPSPRSLEPIRGVPVLCNVLHADRDAARAAAAGDLDLRFCESCGHLWNAAFAPDRVTYDAEYENSLHYSARFQAFARALAADLAARHGLAGGTVVEIACGKGDFLGLLREAGAARAVGFDPSFEPDRHGEVPGVEVRRELFTAATAGDLSCDLLCCRHALEHMADPVDFLRLIHGALAGSPAAPVYLEVPNGFWTLRDLGVWDLIYEHPQYFSARSLATAMARAGFAPEAVDEAFGGQFLGCRAVRRDGPVAAPRTDLADPAALGARFDAAARERRGAWAERLAGWRREGRRAVLWGAGSKGVTFLNVLGAGEEIAGVVDINPHKQGRYVPGTGHPVLAPDAVAAVDPVAVVVMNPLYRDEIGADLAARGCRPELLTV